MLHLTISCTMQSKEAQQETLILETLLSAGPLTWVAKEAYFLRRVPWVRSLPTQTHEGWRLSAIGDLKWSNFLYCYFWFMQINGSHRCRCCTPLILRPPSPLWKATIISPNSTLLYFYSEQLWPHSGNCCSAVPQLPPGKLSDILLQRLCPH